MERKRSLAPIKKISVFMMGAFIVAIVLFIFHQVILGSVGIICLVIFSLLWYRRLGEDLVVYHLRSNSGQDEFGKIIERLSENAKASIGRLEKKGVVEVKENIVLLLDDKYVCTFKKGNIK